MHWPEHGFIDAMFCGLCDFENQHHLQAESVEKKVAMEPSRDGLYWDCRVLSALNAELVALLKTYRQLRTDPIFMGSTSTSNHKLFCLHTIHPKLQTLLPRRPMQHEALLRMLYLEGIA